MQTARALHDASDETTCAHTSVLQRAVRSASSFFLSAAGIAFCLPPCMHPQHPSGTRTQSLSALHTAAGFLPPSPPLPERFRPPAPARAPNAITIERTRPATTRRMANVSILPAVPRRPAPRPAPVSPARPGLGAACALAVAAGCSHLDLHLVDTSVRKPSNVALYFTAQTSKGEPVADLLPADFAIYEDGQRISQSESLQTILQPEVAAIHYTLLLVDMSGSVTSSGDVTAITAAASQFASRVGKYQKVAVAAFDGSPHLTPMTGFGTNVLDGILALGSHKPKDPSTNLHGAVLEGIDMLERQLTLAPVPLRFGTLVVFTDGTDRAHRHSLDDVRKALDETDIEVYVIAAGSEVDEKQLGLVGKSGRFTSRNPGDIARGFDDVGRRIEASSRRYYLLSYCTPSRAGEHELEVEAVDKWTGQKGRLKHRFTAAGFGPGCDPQQKPTFDVRNPRRPAPPGAAPAAAPRAGHPPPPAAPSGREQR